MAGADALIVIPPGAPARAVGDPVQALILGPDTPTQRMALPMYEGV